MKKYKFTGETVTVQTGLKLHRICAIRDFGDVRNGDVGGWIEKEENLPHEGNCWVYDDARVCENGKICENAKVCGRVLVRENGMVRDNAVVQGRASISGNAVVSGNARIYEDAVITGNTYIDEDVLICGETMCENVGIMGHVQIVGSGWIYERDEEGRNVGSEDGGNQKKSAGI